MHPTDGIWRRWGAAVKQAREAAGLTQRQLANAIDVGIGTISDIERGVAGGSEQTKFDISRELQREVAELFAYPSTKILSEVAS